MRERGGDMVVAGKNLGEVVLEMEEIQFKGKSLKLVNQKNCFITDDTKFNARHLLVDSSVLNRISEGDPEALNDIPKVISIRSFLSKKNVSSGKSKTKSASSTVTLESVEQESDFSVISNVDNDIVPGKKAILIISDCSSEDDE